MAHRLMEIRGKVVLITGASQGIGAACAESFRKRGAHLSLTARSADKLRLAGGPDALLLPGDITDPATQERVVNDTIARFARVDILINNAGVGLYSPAWMASMPEARALFELNVFTPLRMVQLIAPHMRRQGSGFIVNLSSIAGKMTLPWFTLYSASKYAVCSLTDGLRMELKADGIRLMAVCPGYVDTNFQSNILGGQVPSAIARSRRFSITAEQCAEAIAAGVENNKRTVVTPRGGWLLIALARMLPWLVDAQLAKMNARHPLPDAGGAS